MSAKLSLQNYFSCVSESIRVFSVRYCVVEDTTCFFSILPWIPNWNYVFCGNQNVIFCLATVTNWTPWILFYARRRCLEVVEILWERHKNLFTFYEFPIKRPAWKSIIANSSDQTPHSSRFHRFEVHTDIIKPHPVPKINWFRNNWFSAFNNY